LHRGWSGRQAVANSVRALATRIEVTTHVNFLSPAKSTGTSRDERHGLAATPIVYCHAVRKRGGARAWALEPLRAETQSGTPIRQTTRAGWR
jgi:hypothetical protein